MVEASVASAGWFPVARAAEVGTTPVPVAAGGRAFVVARLRPGGEVSAFPARCVQIPSPGEHGTPPPRADLDVPWAVEERHGWIWLAPDPVSAAMPPRPEAEPVPEPVPAPPGPDGLVFGNLDPSLEHAWHPVALGGELRPGGWLQVRLLGRTWTLRRSTGGGVSADAPAYRVRERFGVLWLAPAEPADVPLELPEAADRRFVAGWLPPMRSSGPAGPLADNFLDGAHFPFVHAATCGAAGRAEVDPYEVTPEPGGFSSVQEQWCDNPQDPEVATGGRPLRQRRRATYVYRAPFQLRLRLEFLDSLAVTTILFLLQPEDVDSTRIYTCLLLSAGPAQPLVSPGTVAAEIAFEQQVLQEDLDLQAVLATDGLPLVQRDELHVRSARLGVALRRALSDFAAGRPVEPAA